MREPKSRGKHEWFSRLFRIRPYGCFFENAALRTGGKLKKKVGKGKYDMHIGRSIKEELERQDKSVVWLARQLAYSRTNIYKIFERASIDTSVLMRISQVLHVDFFRLYSEEFRQAE